MNQYQYQDFKVEVYDINSSDTKPNFSKQYFVAGVDEYEPTSKYGVRIYQNNTEINSCIIKGFGGGAGIYENSSLMDNDRLVICCCDTIFCLTLPELNLKWKTKADWATCFEVFKIRDEYLVHGEVEVTMLSGEGEIVWKFSGTDIFVLIDGGNAFKLEKDHILVTSFDKREYKLDYKGKELNS